VAARSIADALYWGDENVWRKFILLLLQDIPISAKVGWISLTH